MSPKSYHTFNCLYRRWDWLDGFLGAIGIIMALADVDSGWFGIYGLIESCKDLST
jgi:hypothetical protein